jgi:hypothetical protein
MEKLCSQFQIDHFSSERIKPRLLWHSSYMIKYVIICLDHLILLCNCFVRVIFCVMRKETSKYELSLCEIRAFNSVYIEDSGFAGLIHL